MTDLEKEIIDDYDRKPYALIAAITFGLLVVIIGGTCIVVGIINLIFG